MNTKLYFQWHITDICNFQCAHCYQDNFNEKVDLNFADLVRIYDNIFAFAKGRKVVLTLTGGEPFLKKEFFELAAFLDRNDATEEINVITNGSLISEHIANELSSIKKLKYIKISLDGATSQTNDNIRGKGTFQLAMEGIDLLKRKSEFKISIMFTVMKSNANEVVDMLELCRDLQLDGLVVERFIPLGQSRGLTNEVLDKGDWRNVANDVFVFSGVSVRDEDILPYKAFWVKFERDNIELFGAFCNLGKENFAILPNGDLLPCRRFNFKIGNLLNENLSDIVRNCKLLRELCDRNNLKDRCRTCSITNCYGCRALAYALKGDYFGEDSQCWR